jgi:hypothetical protein
MFQRFFGWIGRMDKSFARTPPPWSPDHDTTAASAADALEKYLMLELLTPKGVHAETILTMVGALAGFAAQHAIWETLVKAGTLPEHGVGNAFDEGAFVLVETTSREKFYFGDLLNSYLVPTPGKLAAYGPGAHTLWAFLISGVEQCGRRPLAREAVTEIFAHSASVVGTSLFGSPRLPPGNRPSITPRAALCRAWPNTRELLECEQLPVAYWPTLIALVAKTLLIGTKDVVDPALSMRIIFEAAIPMSKVDPTTVP